MPARVLTPLTEADLPALQDLLERCGDYYETVYGRPVRPDEAETLWHIVPEGKGRADKHLLGVNQLAGMVDLIGDWPRPGTWLVGFLLLEPAARGRGLGAHVVAAIEGYARERGAQRLRVGVERSNPRARRFWEARGFTHVPPRRADAWALERSLAQ